jgi:hypothetical protein
MRIEKIIDRIRAVPAGIGPEEVYEILKRDFPNLSTNDFFLYWKAAELLNSIS